MSRNVLGWLKAHSEVKEELPSEKTSEQLVEENNLNSETEK